ncbi:hypothetical protein ABZS81_18685 [Streptomyces sp. NPDC005318]|uniref:hypothetical protein n=1 Tax=Streptomyces sp. NPDC005318 TaxID=3157031 RepID=UPI00339DFF71
MDDPVTPGQSVAVCGQPVGERPGSGFESAHLAGREARIIERGEVIAGVREDFILRSAF